MSLLDTALDRRQAFQGRWDYDGAARMRRAVEYGIFQVLEDALQKAPTNNHHQLLQKLYPAPSQPCIISTNYDLIIDTAMMYYSKQPGDPGGRFPDYSCDIQTEFYRSEPKRFGTLLKLHGSLNWLYCGTCHRLEIGLSASTKYVTIMNKVLDGQGVVALENSYLSKGSPCPRCTTELRPLLIAPTHLKNYRNPHISQVWYQAERVLRESGRAIFVGYSLPDDDVEVVYLLKRGLAHLLPHQIAVVEKDDNHPSLSGSVVGRRYRALFGDVDWHTGGLDEWLNNLQAAR